MRLEKQGTQVDWEGLIQRYEDNDDQELAHSETSEDEESDTESTAGLGKNNWSNYIFIRFVTTKQIR